MSKQVIKIAAILCTIFAAMCSLYIVLSEGIPLWRIGGLCFDSVTHILFWGVGTTYMIWAFDMLLLEYLYRRAKS